MMTTWWSSVWQMVETSGVHISVNELWPLTPCLINNHNYCNQLIKCVLLWPTFFLLILDISISFRFKRKGNPILLHHPCYNKSKFFFSICFLVVVSIRKRLRYQSRIKELRITRPGKTINKHLFYYLQERKHNNSNNGNKKRGES